MFSYVAMLVVLLRSMDQDSSRGAAIPTQSATETVGFRTLVVCLEIGHVGIDLPESFGQFRA